MWSKLFFWIFPGDFKGNAVDCRANHLNLISESWVVWIQSSVSFRTFGNSILVFFAWKNCRSIKILFFLETLAKNLSNAVSLVSVACLSSEFFEFEVLDIYSRANAYFIRNGYHPFKKLFKRFMRSRRTFLVQLSYSWQSPLIRKSSRQGWDLELISRLCRNIARSGIF